MKKRIRRIAGALLSLVLVPGMIPGAVQTAAADHDDMETFIYSQVNEAAQRYLDEVGYSPSDYAASCISEYTSIKTSYKKYKPAGLTIDLPAGTLTVHDNGSGRTYTETVSGGPYTFYNITPGVGGEFTVKDALGNIRKQGRLSPTGTLRMIYTDTTYLNIRDLGGWNCDGGTVKYNRLFRSRQLDGITAAEQELLENVLGIRAELDMRTSTEGGGITPLGSSVMYLQQSIGYYEQVFGTLGTRAEAKTALEFIMNCAVEGKACLYHCAAGADRTGTVSYLLLGVLGVSPGDCDKEYEITNFGGPTRLRSDLGALYTAVRAYGGGNFANQCKNALLDCGVSLTLINQFRHAMIDGNPADLAEDTDLVPGDLDGNGVTTDADAIYLLMYTFFPGDYPVSRPCDYNGDGTITDADAIYLLMYTFFPADYPIAG